MYEKAIAIINDIFLDGMQEYEEMLEDIIIKSKLSDDIQRSVLELLDKAQAEFEKRYL